MSDSLLPIFPLSIVLLPRTPLPLHIFEERYKGMIGAAIAGNSEFGIVQAKGNGLVSTGCTVTVERVLQRYSDGRLDILCLGRRRFEIILLNEELDYLRAEVSFFDDEDDQPASTELRVAALASFQKLREETDVQVLGEPDISDPRLSFQLTQLAPDLDFRQMQLITRSEVKRLEQFISFVPRQLETQRLVTHVKRIAPLNGHTGVH